VINETIFLTTLEINPYCGIRARWASRAWRALRPAPASIMKVVVADHNYW